MNQPQIETATVIAENHTLHAAIDASRREIRVLRLALKDAVHNELSEMEARSSYLYDKHKDACTVDSYIKDAREQIKKEATSGTD